MSLLRPAILILLSASLAQNASFFMLVPVFPVHVTTTLGLAATAAGLVLALRQLLQNVPTVLGGAVADRFGHKWTMTLGLVARALGLLGFAYATNLPTLLLSAALVALGGSSFDAASRAAIALLVPQPERVKVFAILSMVFVISSTVGPILGVFAFQLGFAFVCFSAAAWLLLSAALIVPIATAKHAAPGASASVLESLTTAFGDRVFLRFSLVSSGLWYLGSLLYVALPLHVTALTGSVELVGVLFSLYAVTVLALQYPVVSLAAGRIVPLRRIAFGLAVQGIGLGLIGVLAGVPGLLLGLTIVALGRILTEPTFNEIVANLAPERSLATYMGLGYLGLGLGGALGNLSAGMLFDVAVDVGALWLPWLIYACIGLALAAVFAKIRLEGRT